MSLQGFRRWTWLGTIHLLQVSIFLFLLLNKLNVAFNVYTDEIYVTDVSELCGYIVTKIDV